MPRHNREDRGSDQRGFEYRISYQPDWLQAVKVTRSLESGRQSTKTLFRNPNRRQQDPGERVRTRITCPEQNLDFEITLTDPVKSHSVCKKWSGSCGGLLPLRQVSEALVRLL